VKGPKHVVFSLNKRLIQILSCFFDLLYLLSRPITGHEVQGREEMCSSNPFLPSALDGGGWLKPPPASLPPRKTRYSLYRRLGGPQCLSRMVWKISPPPDSFPGPSSFSKSLYRLSYPGLPLWLCAETNRRWEYSSAHGVQFCTWSTVLHMES
jgi:hypothetical protein